MDTKLIDKLTKLFAVAERSSFPEEAASALGKAQALMTEHKISMEALKEAEGGATEEEIKTFEGEPLNSSDKGKVNSSTWKNVLAQVLSRNNGCYVFKRRAQIIITGTPTNVASVRYLYAYCVKEIDRLTKLNGKGKGRTFCNNFRLGCVEAVTQAIKKEYDEIRNRALANSKQLVVVDKVLQKYKDDYNSAKRFVNSKYRLRSSSASCRGSEEGKAEGLRAGQGIYKGNSSRALPSPQRSIAY